MARSWEQVNVIRGLGGALRGFYEIRWHSFGIFYHLHNLPFVSLHSDNFQKTRVIMEPNLINFA